MANFNVVIDDEVAKYFRLCVIQRYGTLRGHIDECVEIAIKTWCLEEQPNLKMKDSKIEKGKV